MNMNPSDVARNRTARLVREARTPAYTTDTLSARARAEAVLLQKADFLAMDEDFCHICSRATDHRGEHTDAQILAWASQPGLLQSLLKDA
jgi:hypothetical protein